MKTIKLRLPMLWLAAIPALLWATRSPFNEHDLTPIILLLTGGLLGAALNYFQFGFSSSFRSLITQQKTAGMRAIIWMLGLSIFLFAPLLAIGGWQGVTFQGYIRTLSLAIPIGAFIFGIGMQIGCGCTSGTLNRVGQLQPLSFTTLFFMVVGGTLAASSYNEWQHLPEIAPFAFQQEFGWITGLALQLTLLAILYKTLLFIERRQHGLAEALAPVQAEQANRSQNFHPFLIAAISLAFLNAFLLLVSGSPWSISSIFPYWGIRLIDTLQLPVDWAFWDYAMEHSRHLSQGMFENTVSLTTMGVILGALMVSLIHPRSKVPVRGYALLGSAVGGTIMGFGAVMASGCNIGAFFSGIASGSGHGWIWLLFALMGNAIGTALRGYFQER